MPSRANGPVASPARAWLLAACAFGFAIVLWDSFASPRYDGRLEFDIEGGPVVYTVTNVVSGGAGALAGIRVGDKVEFPRPNTISQGIAVRRLIAGRPIPLRVQRGTSVFQISSVAAPLPFSAITLLSDLTNGWETILAAIVAWFGVGRRARLVSWLVLLGALNGAGLDGFVSPWPWLNEAAYLLNAPVTALSAALLATVSSTFGRPISPLRRTLEWSTYAVAAVGVAVPILLFELFMITPWFDWSFPFLDFNNRFFVGWIVANLQGVACAVLALATVRGDERQRAAWLLTPLAALFFVTAAWVVASGFAGGAYSEAQQSLEIAAMLAVLSVFAVMTYAVLRRRLIDVEFVANRAVVFAGVSFIVIGIFVAFEWLFNKFFERATHTESTIASLGIALALGVSLSYIHHYVDKFVDRVIFRKRHEREKALRDFAHEATFITDREVLLDDTVHDVRKNAETDDIAILLLGPDGTYTPARTTNGVCSNVGPNDRAILKLRAWHKPIDLHDVETTLTGTRVYPLMSRGELLGVLVCGDKRDHQGFAPDEDDALFTMARGVGSALGALREPSQDGTADAICEVREMIRGMPTEIVRLVSASRRVEIMSAEDPIELE